MAGIPKGSMHTENIKRSKARGTCTFCTRRADLLNLPIPGKHALRIKPASSLACMHAHIQSLHKKINLSKHLSALYWQPVPVQPALALILDVSLRHREAYDWHRHEWISHTKAHSWQKRNTFTRIKHMTDQAHMILRAPTAFNPTCSTHTKSISVIAWRPAHCIQTFCIFK